mgnify:CR=1 FL=1
MSQTLEETVMDSQQANAASRAAWEANAAHWDDYMGAEGNDFVNVLIWPAVQPLLNVKPGQRILDAACGNGMYARKLGARGADVVAFDFSHPLIERARAYPHGDQGAIAYHVLDATDEGMLRALGEGTFDAVSCQMALMDMPEIAPLMRAAYALLKPGGCFVFSLVHPAFFQTNAIRFAEMVEREGELVTVYGMKITQYMTPYTAWGSAIPGQPEVQPYFDRPLHVTLGAGFAAGFVLDALEERAFPPLHPQGNPTRPLSWGANFSDIPLVLVARLRR